MRKFKINIYLILDSSALDFLVHKNKKVAILKFFQSFFTLFFYILTQLIIFICMTFVFAFKNACSSLHHFDNNNDTTDNNFMLCIFFLLQIYKYDYEIIKQIRTLFSHRAQSFTALMEYCLEGISPLR